RIRRPPPFRFTICTHLVQLLPRSEIILPATRLLREYSFYWPSFRRRSSPMSSRCETRFRDSRAPLRGYLKILKLTGQENGPTTVVAAPSRACLSGYVFTILAAAG
ncbi:MAG TPA: hypothetical protein VN521_04145, partial [Negativicutes bacterium]|nr:hypothetical protein [Negativicutes bacterium]